MGKRSRSSSSSSHHDNNETPEERKERKRLKKSSKQKQQHHDTVSTSTTAPPTTTTTSSSSSPSAGPVASQQPSLYYNKKLQLSVSLLPCGLRNVVESAKESIRRTLLLKYCNPMGGILLAFDHVQVVTSTSGGGGGRILEELPHIHYDVTCNALVFCPSTTAGSHHRLDGTVVESSFHSHLSLVVHGHFNASISSNQMRKSGFTYDENMGQWYHVASQTFLQQEQQDNMNTTALLDLEEEEDDDENDEKSPCRPLAAAAAAATRIQFTLHKLHEVGGIISMDGSDPTLLL